MTMKTTVDNVCRRPAAFALLGAIVAANDTGTTPSKREVIDTVYGRSAATKTRAGAYQHIARLIVGGLVANASAGGTYELVATDVGRGCVCRS